MGRLVVNTFLTLDGVMQAPGQPDEDRDGGFDQGGWQVPFFDEESGEVMSRHMADFDALLLGRRTYELFAAYWPQAPADDPIAARLNSAPKFVASRTLDRADWTNSTVLKGDLAREVPAVKGDYNETHVIGSGNLVQSLMRHGLVDAYNLWIYPVLLGDGKRLFADGTVPTALRRTQSKVFGNGAMLVSYEVAGEPEFGTTALDTDRPG
jgi:dihydrofolate reductase